MKKGVRVMSLVLAWSALTLLLLPHFCQAEKRKEVEEELAHSLILAASPFVNWRPSSLARRLNMSRSDNLVKDGDERNDEEDSGSESSRIHEVRVAAPFSVRRSIDREGKSLYSPGPHADR